MYVDDEIRRDFRAQPPAFGPVANGQIPAEKVNYFGQ